MTNEKIFEQMGDKDLVEQLDGEKRRLLEDTDKTLLRVFRKAALESKEKGDIETFQKLWKLVKRVERY